MWPELARDEQAPALGGRGGAGCCRTCCFQVSRCGVVGRAVGTAAGEAAVALEVERLRGLSPAMRRRIVRAAARSVGSRLSFEETAKLLALGGFGGYEGVTGRVGSRLELRGGLRAERSARELRFWRAG